MRRLHILSETYLQVLSVISTIGPPRKASMDKAKVFLDNRSRIDYIIEIPMTHR